jgi:hypothetical protein
MVIFGVIVADVDGIARGLLRAADRRLSFLQAIFSRLIIDVSRRKLWR